MKAEIVIPTFLRSKKLSRCLDSILVAKKQMRHIDNIKIHIYFDNNDMNSFSDIFETYKKHLLSYHILPYQYKAFGIWNHHLQDFNSDVFIYICDDVEIYPNMLLNLFALFRKRFPDKDGVITFNQANLKSCSIYAMGAIGKKFIKRFPNKQVFCPEYSSFYADSELGLYASSVNKFCYAEECKLTHYHPSIIKSEIDKTHAIVRNEKSRIDKEVWRLRQKKKLLWGNDFSRIYKKILSCDFIINS